MGTHLRATERHLPHTCLPATRHRWARTALSQARLLDRLHWTCFCCITHSLATDAAATHP